MDNFCLIIPCNRTEFLDSVSKFYSSTKIKVKIVHNLSKDFQNNLSSNIEFIFIDKVNSFMRVIDSLKKINEKYCMLFSDDDFVFEDTIKRSINFLEANDDFVILSWQAREPKKVGKGKETVQKTLELPYTDIKEAIVTVTF